MTHVELVRLSHLPVRQEARMELCVVTWREIIRSSVVVVVILVVAVLVMAGLSAATAIATVTAAGTAGLALIRRSIEARDCERE
jgi:hypothetical protein